MISFLLSASILALASFIIKRIHFLSFYRIPPSLVSGIPILILFTYFSDFKSLGFYVEWKTWPSITISLVFAAIFLEVPEKKETHSNFDSILSQTSYVFFAILGQILIGLVLTLFLFKPIFDLPLPFSSVLEAGFAGGHGTAVALDTAFKSTGMPAGMEYSLFSATVGIVLGIVGGLGIVTTKRQSQSLEETKEILHAEDELSGFSLNSFLLGFGLISLAVLLGSICKTQVETKFPQIPSFPLFVYSLIISVIIRKFLQFTEQYKYFTNSLFAFFSAFFMEFMVFSAIVTMDLQVISNALVPLGILFTVGFFWNLFCHVYIRKKLLPNEYGFELSIINFGMLNGTTAIGLMLLKIIDPKLQSPAVKVYAESAPLSAPFVGGGILSLTLPYLVTKKNEYFITLLIFLGMLIAFTLGAKAKKKIDS